MLGFDLQSLRGNLDQALGKLRHDPGLLRRALLFLRATGEVLYYEQLPGLADRVFIKPQWLVDVMKELVHHDLDTQLHEMSSGEAAKYPLAKELGTKFIRNGVLDRRLLPWLWLT